jgi:RNA polymerase sigma-70 factor (ECF subfamily)
MNKRGAEYVTNEKALVLRIAKRKIARHYSLLERLRIFVSMSTTNEDGEEVDLSDLEADAFLTEDFSVNHALIETVRQFIDTKPEDVQKVFYLMYDIDLTIPEIAKALSISESNVKNKLYRTLKEIRNLIK